MVHCGNNERCQLKNAIYLGSDMRNTAHDRTRQGPLSSLLQVFYLCAFLFSFLTRTAHFKKLQKKDHAFESMFTLSRTVAPGLAVHSAMGWGSAS